MKKLNKLLIALFLPLVFLLAGAINASATTTPLDNGPFYLNYQNYESFSDPAHWNSENDQSGDPVEDNWGIINVTRYNLGAGSGTGITDSGDWPDTWRRGDGGVELTGLFYGIDIVKYDFDTDSLDAIGGNLDIYVNDAGDLGSASQDLASTYDSNDRTIDNITDGDLWLSLEFVPGVAQEGTDGTNYTVTATSLDDTDPISGASQSYFRITGGAMADYFIHDYYDMPFGDETATFFSKNSFNEASDGTGFGFSHKSEDPVVGYAVPEPTTFLLFGTSLLGFAAFGRKRLRTKK